MSEQILYPFIENEGQFRTNAYQDTGGIWTIGFGTIMYKDGTRVKKGDTITLGVAREQLNWEAQQKLNAIKHAIRVPLTSNQIDAIISFCYNEGVDAFLNSTLLKRINAGENEDSIRAAFYMWNKGKVLETQPDGSKKYVLKVINGLTLRRKREADLYFKSMT